MVGSQSACFHSLKRIVSVAQFCAGNARDDESWVTVCNGDSGGGFAVPSLIRQRYHIHGIVSTGGLHSKSGTCEKHAVFTRVFQFITWIRQTLEQVNGEVIRELQSTANYPYIVQGTETMHSSFSSIPRHLDNLVTSVELSYTDLRAEGLLKSLEQNIGLQSLNLTRVRFTDGLPVRSTILPRLKSFILDLPTLDCWDLNYRQLKSIPCASKDPAELTRGDLKSLLFFDKFEMTDWPLAQISHLGTNIELTLHTTHIIQIDHGSGIVNLQIPFCPEILENLAGDFTLRHLALRKCDLVIPAMTGRVDVSKIQTLVLNEVSFKAGGLTDLLIVALQSLEHLVVTNSSDDNLARRQKSTGSAIDLGSLPPTIKSLAFSNINVQFGGESSSQMAASTSRSARGPLIKSRSGITFPESMLRRPVSVQSQIKQQSAPEKISLSKLETFYCNFCTLDVGARQNFASIVQFAKRIILIGNQALNITEILVKSRRLERIMFANVHTNNHKFIGLDRIRWLNPPVSKSSPKEFSIFKSKGHWVKTQLRIRPEILIYAYEKQQNFYTSFEEFEAEARLTSFEKAAYISGNYKFGKRAATNDALLPRVPQIPSAIRKNLKSVEITGVEIAPSDLLESLKHANNLESLILDNVRLLGYFVNFIELPNLRRYTLNAVSNSQGFLDQTAAVYGINFYVPFSQTPKGSGLQTGLKRFDNVPIPGHPTKMETFEISVDDCNILALDFTKSTFIATHHVGQNILPWLHRMNLTKIALRLSENDFGPLTLPQGVNDLDLRCRSEYEWHCSKVFPNLLQPLDSLSTLRVALHHAFEDWYNRTTFSIGHLSKSAERLQLLGIENGILEFSLGIKFPQLNEVIFDSCTFDNHLAMNFLDVFSVQTVAILGKGYYKYGPTLEAEYHLTNMRIFLSALRNEKVIKIIGDPDMTLLSDTKEYKDLSKLLLDALVPMDEREFMLERTRGGKWRQIGANLSSEKRKDLLDMEVRRLRGDAAFRSASCIKRLFDNIHFNPKFPSQL